MPTEIKLNRSEEYLLKWAFTKGFQAWFDGLYMFEVSKDSNHASDIKQIVIVAKLLHKLFSKPKLESQKVFRFMTSHKPLSSGVSIQVRHAYSAASYACNYDGLISFVGTAGLSPKEYAYILIADTKSTYPLFTVQYLLDCVKNMPNAIDIGRRTDFVRYLKPFSKQHEVVLLSTKAIRVKAYALPDKYPRNYTSIRDGVRQLKKTLASSRPNVKIRAGFFNTNNNVLQKIAKTFGEVNIYANKNGKVGIQ